MKGFKPKFLPLVPEQLVKVCSPLSHPEQCPKTIKEVSGLVHYDQVQILEQKAELTNFLEKVPLLH